MADGIVHAWARVVHRIFDVACGRERARWETVPACAFLDAVQRGCLMLPEVPAGIVRLLRAYAFRLAIWNDHADTLQALMVMCAASWDTISARRGSLRLHQAAAYGCLGTVAALLNAKADIEDVCRPGGADMTPLAVAAGTGNGAVVSLLLEAKAQLDGPACMWRGPLQLAAEYGEVASVKLLLHAKAQVNRQDGSGKTALCRAAACGQNGTVALLLREGADVNAQDGREHGTLYHAALFGHPQTASMLLDAKANVNNNRGSHSESPLIAAVRYCSGTVTLAFVAILLQAKANVNVVHWGQTPLSICRRRGLGTVLKLLLEAQSAAAAAGGT